MQLGAPRKAGKEGTVDAELYTHRAGRAGRVGGDKGVPADAVRGLNLQPIIENERDSLVSGGFKMCIWVLTLAISCA